MHQGTQRHPGPGQTSPGHSGPGHPGPRTSRSPDIQVPGHPGLSDIQVFRTSRSPDIQVFWTSRSPDIQVFWTSRSQPKDNVTPMHTLWDNCCTRFEDTQFECGLRPLRPFGPGTLVARSSNVASGSKRTRFAASRLSLPNQPKDNVTPMHTLWHNCCTRFEDTQFECGLRPLRPFGPERVSHAVRMSHADRMWPSAPNN